MISHMEFECKLAHMKKGVKTIGGFNSIKELYEKIKHIFEVPPNQILYCTLNSADPRNMDNLLANYLSIGDTINVHLLGQSEILKLVKSQEHLGLTITDNGHGRAFVKRMKCNDARLEKSIKPGDHIAKINGQSVVGLRHFEVAKALRQIPLNADFELEIIKPLMGYETCDEDSFDCKQQSTNTSNNVHNENKRHNHKNGHNQHQQKHQPQSLMLIPSHRDPGQADTYNLSAYDYVSLEDLADSSLPLDRILSRTSASNSSAKVKNDVIMSINQDIYKTIIKRINSILESFIGIDDHKLAIRIYRLARDHENSIQEFLNAIKSSELSVFDFGSDIASDLWNCVNKAL